MQVEELELSQFRNIDRLTLKCQESLHLFVGPNAQGKTNILESLYVLALGKSHRTRKDKELIRWGADASQIKARVSGEFGNHRLDIRLTSRGKKVMKNGLEQRRLSSYIGTLTAVLFAPEDLTIVKGSPQVRRRFIDMELGQVNPSYIHELTCYNQLLLQRNQLLKDMGSRRDRANLLLEVMDEQMIELSTSLWKKRATFIEQLTKWAQDIHTSVTQGRENLTIQYLSGVPIADGMDEADYRLSLQKELHRLREQELKRGMTLTGPHRDDIRLSANEVDIHTFGSQGQQRTAALSLKLAEIELIYQETGTYPILLLDDVLSELDDYRKTHLLVAIRGKVQTFVTATGLEGIDHETCEHARIYRVQQGSITEQG